MKEDSSESRSPQFCFPKEVIAVLLRHSWEAKEGEECKENTARSEKSRGVMQYSAASNFQPGQERLDTVLSVGFRM